MNPVSSPESKVRRSARAIHLWPAVSLLVASPALAATPLTVDLSAPMGPVTHVASGSLYGVTETLPADVNAWIAPLHPKMFNNPAADVQQPIGDAIVVAGRVAPTGAQVTIRLADWLKGFYTFTSMTDWLSKVDQTVSRKKAAGLTNIYAYEIWNEPNGTYASSNPLSFDEFWRQTFVELRKVDPGVKITGPSLSYYNEAFLKDFLSFCKTNSCLPDIVGWHELEGGNFTGTMQSYRSLEKQLGIGPLPVSINEYSGVGHINVEGQPGASAPLIAKFERLGVDSASISFWDVGHPGRLGSLMASNTEPNGGWWFYKWYGDMAGTMVSTTPPSPADATALDGFANLDTTGRSASVLVGGVNDGTIQIVVKGFKTASFFGATVHAVVEHTRFVNRTTVVNATDTVSTNDLAVANDQISVSVTGANSTDGYRLRLTTIGGGGGAGGSGGSGGSSGGGGASSTGGAGQAGAGGASAAGSAGSAGRLETGGSSGSGGAGAFGGQSGAAGALALGGAAGSGNTGGVAGAGGSSKTKDPGSVAASPNANAGCGCRVGRTSNGPGRAASLTLSLLLAWRLTRRRRRVGRAGGAS
jgi:Glycosyl hydrolases family 39